MAGLESLRFKSFCLVSKVETMSARELQKSLALKQRFGEDGILSIRQNRSIIMFSSLKCGGVAQLGERLLRM